MPCLGVGQAGIGHLGDEVSEVAGIADRALYALVGQEADEHDLAHAEIAQDVVDMRRDEDGR